MLLRRKRFKKDSPKQRLKIVLLVICFAALLLLTPSFLYIIYYYSGYSYINPVSFETNSQTLKVEDILHKNKIEFVNIVKNSDNSESVNLKTGGQVIFSTKKNLDSQVASLQLMLARLTIEGKKLKTLDFRFDNPVVTFN